MIPEINKIYRIEYVDAENPDDSFIGIAKCRGGGTSNEELDDDGNEMEIMYSFEDIETGHFLQFIEEDILEEIEEILDNLTTT